MTCIFIFSDSFGLSVKITDVSFYEENQFVYVEIVYELKNGYKHDIFLYDINKGNDMQYEEDSCISTNTISKKIFVFKPSKISSWGASWGYSPNYPTFIKIAPNNSLKGSVNLKYKIQKSLSPMEITYEFNFIFADFDVSEYIGSFSTDEINEKFLHNKIVRFNLK